MLIKKLDMETHPSLEDVLAELKADTEILLMKGDEILARISRPDAKLQERILGLHEGQGWISPDFTDELPMSFWLGN